MINLLNFHLITMKTLYKVDVFGKYLKFRLITEEIFLKAQSKALFCNSVFKWTLPLLEYYSTEILH